MNIGLDAAGRKARVGAGDDPPAPPGHRRPATAGTLTRLRPGDAIQPTIVAEVQAYAVSEAPGYSYGATEEY